MITVRRIRRFIRRWKWTIGALIFVAIMVITLALGWWHIHPVHMHVGKVFTPDGDD